MGTTAGRDATTTTWMGSAAGRDATTTWLGSAAGMGTTGTKEPNIIVEAVSGDAANCPRYRPWISYC